MRVSATPLVTLLGLPALAASFLIPPAAPEDWVSKLASVTDVVGGEHLAITVPCTGCVWHKDVADVTGTPYQEGLESELLFDITIPSSARRSLLINGQPIIPFRIPSSGLKALQVPPADETDIFITTHAFRPLKLGFDLLVTGTINVDVPGQKQIIVRLRVTSVEGVHNDDIEEVWITISEDMASGDLALVAAEKLPLKHAQLEPVYEDVVITDDAPKTDAPATCQGFDCMFSKLRHKADRVRGNKKGCHGKKHGDRTRYRSGYHGHREQRRPQHHFWNAVVKHVLIPILIGIVAGVSVSVVALVVSQGAMKIWSMICARRGQGQVQEVKRSDEERGLLKNMEDDELPAYVEEGIEVVEKE